VCVCAASMLLAVCCWLLLWSKVEARADVRDAYSCRSAGVRITGVCLGFHLDALVHLPH
jgi:hypothetical protein